MTIKNNIKNDMKAFWQYLIIGLLVVSIIVFNIYTRKREAFTNSWSPDLIKRFNIFQNTVNLNNVQFNLDMLQQQASPEEVEQLIRTGYWPWPDDLKYEYMDKVWSNPIIKIAPQYSLDYAMKIYNKNAASQLLGWNTKEGQFLLYGGDLGRVKYEDLPSDYHNTIMCSTDERGNSVIQKKTYTGFNLWNGYMNSTTETVRNEDIPKEMPGFSFVNSPCNPCVALNSPADYSCPFRLNVRGDNQVSPIWKKLWSLD